MAEQFTLFWGHRLSQWHRVAFEVGGLRFDYAEQFMMHAKALLFGDRAAATRILAAPTPKEQQAIGRQVRGFEEAIWVQFREGIVFQGNYARFSQNPDQRELLFATRGTTLVEASPHGRVPDVVRRPHQHQAVPLEELGVQLHPDSFGDRQGAPRPAGAGVTSTRRC